MSKHREIKIRTKSPLETSEFILNCKDMGIRLDGNIETGERMSIDRVYGMFFGCRVHESGKIVLSCWCEYHLPNYFNNFNAPEMSPKFFLAYMKANYFKTKMESISELTL